MTWCTTHSYIICAVIACDSPLATLSTWYAHAPVTGIRVLVITSKSCSSCVEKISGGWRRKCFSNNNFAPSDLNDSKRYTTIWTIPNGLLCFFLWSSNLFDCSTFSKSGKATQILCIIAAKCPSMFLQIPTIRHKCSCFTNQNQMRPVLHRLQKQLVVLWNMVRIG